MKSHLTWTDADTFFNVNDICLHIANNLTAAINIFRSVLNINTAILFRRKMLPMIHKLL
jgi:hypothetical protein